MTLGEKIRTLRIEHEMTMEDLAGKIGVQRSAINKYEKGIVTDLKRSTIAALARALDVSPCYLLEDDDDIRNDLDQRLLNAFHAASSEIVPAVCRKLLSSYCSMKGL